MISQPKNNTKHENKTINHDFTNIKNNWSENAAFVLMSLYLTS